MSRPMATGYATGDLNPAPSLPCFYCGQTLVRHPVIDGYEHEEGPYAKRAVYNLYCQNSDCGWSGPRGYFAGELHCPKCLDNNLAETRTEMAS